MATATYDLIASQTLGSAVNTVTFASITSAYTDLRLVVVARESSSGDSFSVRFNSDTAANYSSTYMQGRNSYAAVNTATSQTLFTFAQYQGVGTTYPSFYTIDLFSYTSSYYKTLLHTEAYDQNNSNGNTTTAVGLWRNTSAVTQIDVFMTTSSIKWATGSTFNLYGIKAA